VDLAEIKKAYMENRRVELARAVEGVSKGDYRRILVAIASQDTSPALGSSLCQGWQALASFT